MSHGQVSCRSSRTERRRRSDNDLVVTANRLDYDENGVLEMWQGPAEAERLVAVFSPQAWLRAYDTAQVSEHEPTED